MARRRRSNLKWPPELRRLARDLASQETPPKQHHLVPASYLKAWEEPDVLKVTVLDEQRSFVTTAHKAARESQFYRMESDDLDPELMPPLLIEALLAQVEGDAGPVLQKLRDRPMALTADEKFTLCQFLAFQATRGVATRRQLAFLSNEYFRITYGGLSDDGIRDQLLQIGQIPSDDDVARSREFVDGLNDGSITVQPQQAALVAQSLQHAETVGEHMFNRVWVVYETANILLTTDEQVSTHAVHHPWSSGR